MKRAYFGMGTLIMCFSGMGLRFRSELRNAFTVSLTALGSVCERVYVYACKWKGVYAPAGTRTG